MAPPKFMRSDDDYSSDEDTGAGFFATKKPAGAEQITKSKWLSASRSKYAVAESSSSDGDDETSSDEETSTEEESTEATSSEDESSAASSSEAEQDENDEDVKPAKPAAAPARGINRFLKDSVLKARGIKPVPTSSASESSDDSMFPSESDESSESGEDELPADPAARRARWLKDAVPGSDKEAKRTGPAQKPSIGKKTVAEDEDGFVKVGGAKEGEKDPADQLLGNVHAGNVIEKLHEVVLVRGKKGTERETIIIALERILALAQLPFQQVKILLSLVSCHFDYASTATNFLPVMQWKHAADRIKSILDLLDAHPDLVLREDVEEEEDEVVADNLREHGDSAAPLRVRGSLVAMIDRLDEEFYKTLQASDLQSPEFAELLRQEVTVWTLLLRTQLYASRINDSEALHRVLLRRVEHAYFKRDAVNQQLDQFIVSHFPELESVASTSVQHMCEYLYQHASDRARTRAVLCHVYHHAVHDRFYQARDMLLMSGLQDLIRTTDVPTQGLFNRTMVQIGLCAFRMGLMKECHYALHDILTTGYARELLNQGLMQVNMELIEACYQTASMLCEVPYIAANPHDQGKRRVMSKTFRRMFEAADRAVFQGPPENTRDYIVAAAKAMFQGNWPLAYQHLASVRVWAHFGSRQSAIRDMLKQRVKETGLSTWVHLTSTLSSSISLEHLASMFELPASRVQAIVAQMVHYGDIQGKIDGVKNLLVVSAPPSKVQWLSQQLADKLLSMADTNDKMLDTRGGRSGDAYHGGDRKKHYHHHKSSKPDGPRYNKQRNH